MAKFSLEWLLQLKQNELNKIELELAEVNSKIENTNNLITKNNEFISSKQRALMDYSIGWQIQSAIRSIDSCEQANSKLKTTLEFLNKERTMIFNRYNSKRIEIKMLEKSKSNFLAKENHKKELKLQAEINELSLVTRKDG